MVKDYLQNELAEDDSELRQARPRTLSVRDDSAAESVMMSSNAQRPERSIRNISIPQRKSARVGSDVRPPAGVPPHDGDAWRRDIGQPPRRSRRTLLWAITALCVAILGILALFAFRNTTITVVPLSEALVFDQAIRFELMPEGGNAPAYTIMTSEFEDSAVVPSKGTEEVSERASGLVTLFNEHSSSPVRLLKNTRLEAPSGLIFRIPDEILIPGKNGALPGTATVTVVADMAGDTYNVGPIDTFTLPGLKTSGAMYTNIYARSSTAIHGGFEGARPAVAAGDMESARAEIRERLEKKARESARAAASASSIVFPDLMRITYESLPQTAEAGGGARIRDKAIVEIPVIPASVFAEYAAQLLDIDTLGSSVRIDGVDTLTATREGSSDAPFSEQALAFTLSGNALLVWNVDASALTEALAGKDQSEFEPVVAGVPSIAAARVRIQPFWKDTFPGDVSDIRVKIREPK